MTTLRLNPVPDTLRLTPAGQDTLALRLLQGATGAPGTDGTSATIAAGTTTTLAEGNSATVVNAGSSSAAIFDFGIPRGAIPATGFNFDTSTLDADPGDGDVRFNHATPASVTAIYFDNLDRDGNTVTSWLDSLDDSTATVKGTLTIVPAASPSAKLIYNVSGTVVDGTGYRKVTVSHVVGTTLPSSAAHLGFVFARTGNNGADGAGTGDVVGPASAADNRLAAFDGTTGKLIKDSGVTIANVLTEAEAAAAYQPLDSDLTAIAAISPSNDDIIQRKAGAWTNRSIAQLLTDLAAPGTTFQPLDSTLTSLAAHNTDGLLTQTAADTFTGRTLTGTANEISVTNGSGVGGNPTLSLPSTIDLGGKASFEIPNSAAPAVDADGEIALDTSVADFSHGIPKIFGGEELGIVVMPIAQFTSPTNGYVVAYNSTADEFQLTAPGSGGNTTPKAVARFVCTSSSLGIVSSVSTAANSLTYASGSIATGDAFYIEATAPAGLTARQLYYARNIGAGPIITLHPTYDDAVNNTNTIDITSAGSGNRTGTAIAVAASAVNTGMGTPGLTFASSTNLTATFTTSTTFVSSTAWYATPFIFSVASLTGYVWGSESYSTTALTASLLNADAGASVSVFNLFPNGGATRNIQFTALGST